MLQSASCAANASAMPWSINALSWALVTGVVVVVVASDALVVLFFGAISFKSPSDKSQGQWNLRQISSNEQLSTRVNSKLKETNCSLTPTHDAAMGT
ncbi:hypothetical protein Tco_0814447 [Tanacetum coccineum]